MTVEIRSFTQEDAITHASAAAELVYTTADKVFDMVFGSHGKAVEVLSALFPVEDSLCGFNLGRGAFEDGQLLGLEIGYDGPTKERLDAESPNLDIFAAHLSEPELLHVIGLDPYLPFLMHPHTPEGAYYILNLASAPEARGKGIGKALLQGAFERAQDQDLTTVQLDVFNDKPAVPFYISQGMDKVAENFVFRFRDEFDVPPFLRMVKWLDASS